MLVSLISIKKSIDFVHEDSLVFFVRDELLSFLKALFLATAVWILLCFGNVASFEKFEDFLHIAAITAFTSYELVFCIGDTVNHLLN